MPLLARSSRGWPLAADPPPAGLRQDEGLSGSWPGTSLRMPGGLDAGWTRDSVGFSMSQVSDLDGLVMFVQVGSCPASSFITARSESKADRHDHRPCQLTSRRPI